MRPSLFVGALALALFSAPALARVEANTSADYGGFVNEYKAFVRHAKKHHLRVTIRGICGSACLLKLGVGPTLRISPAAHFWPHEIHNATAGSCNTALECYARGARDEAGIADFRARLPACADRLFSSRNGFGSPQAVPFTGAEVLAACPQIRSIRGG